MPEPRTPTGPTVTVAGAGAASAVPDTALLQLGVETRGSTPAEALEACRQALDQVLAALDAEGVEPARRTTSGLELHEDWESRQPGKGPASPTWPAPGSPSAWTGRNGPARSPRPRSPSPGPAPACTGSGSWSATRRRWRRRPGRRPGGTRSPSEQYAELAGPPSARSSRSGRRLRRPRTPAPMRLWPPRPAPAGPATEPGETTIWAAVTVTWSLHPR